MTTSIWLDRPQKNSIKKDFVIIGAGLSGLSIAFWLRKSFPNCTIGVIERFRLGFGASGRNAGVLSAGSINHLQNLISLFGPEKALRIWKIAESNKALLEEYLQLSSDEKIGYFKCGSLSVAETSEQFSTYLKSAETLSSKGIHFEEVHKVDLQNLYNLNGFEGAFYNPEDGALNPFELLKKLLALSSAELFEGVEVLGFAESATGKVAVRSDRGLFECSQLFISTNAYISQLLPNFEERMHPVRGQALVTEPTTLKLCPVVYSSSERSFIRQLDDGSLLVSGFKRDTDSKCLSTEDITTIEVQKHLEQFIQKHLSWANPNVRYRWAGVIGVTKSYQPIVGTLQGNKNIFIASGFSGYGNSFAFQTAKHLVDHIQGMPLPDIFESP